MTDERIIFLPTDLPTFKHRKGCGTEDICETLRPCVVMCDGSFISPCACGAFRLCWVPMSGNLVQSCAVVGIDWSREGDRTCEVTFSVGDSSLFELTMQGLLEALRGRAREEDVAFEGSVGDNASAELIALARSGDREGFDAMAGCLMPSEAVAECWAGTRQRLGLGPR